MLKYIKVCMDVRFWNLTQSGEDSNNMTGADHKLSFPEKPTQ